MRNTFCFMKSFKDIFIRTICLGLLFTSVSCTKPQQTITLESLLKEMVSVEDLSRFPEPYYTCKQVSSYDRRSISANQPGWFANDDGFGAVAIDTVENVVKQVLFDEEGPGVITRMWITTNNKKGVFKFYFNHSAEPDWIIEGFDLSKTGLPLLDGLAFRHTHYNEEVEKTGGNTLFLPIPYAEHCKIVFESPVSMGRTPRYYHINYRTYPQGTEVKTFDFEEAKTLAPLLESVTSTLLHPISKGKEIKESSSLASGTSMQLNCPEGEQAIRQLNFNINITDSSQYAEIMRQLVVKAQFDGKETVWVPLSDFSGGGFGAPYVKSWYLDADGKGNVTVRWIMPYRKHANIELINYSQYEVKAGMSALIDNYKWDEQRSLYFHASWKQENAIELSNNPEGQCSEWRFAQIEGRGIYAGDLLTLFNHSPAWYGEGDEKIWVDDDTFPSHFGTGTEDYYNCSWAPVVPFHTPFGGAPRADLPSSHGYNAFMRTRNLDVIPFRKKFIFDIEMLSWQKGSVDYATTIFWYGDYDSKAVGTSGIDEVTKTLLPAPENPRNYSIPNSIEFETMDITNKTPSLRAEKQGMSGFPDGKWSRAEHLLFPNGNVGDFIEFEFSNLKNKKYKMVLYATLAKDYGTLSFSVNDKPTNVRFDGYNEIVTNSKPINLGMFYPESGKIKLRVQIAGTNKQSQGAKYMFGLDCIQLLPQ